MQSYVARGTSLTLCILLLAACAPSARAPAPAPLSTLAPASASALDLTDDLGRKVSLPSVPKRIVSLAPSKTEILFAVGAGPQVVGVTRYCTYPAGAQQGREIIGGFTAESISVEKVLALQPDLVFTAGTLHRPVIEALERARVPVYALDAKDLDGIYQDITAVGRITGHPAESQAVVEGMQRRVAAVSEKVRDIPPEKRLKVFYEVWDEPLMTASPHTFIGQVIELAGGANIFADAQEQYPTVSAELVVARNPDVILGPSTHGDALTTAKIAARPGWQPIKAVQAGRLATIDGDIASHAGPRIVDALQSVARLLYPERFRP